MTTVDNGFKSEALQSALSEALAGKPARFEDLLARHGAALTPRPNLKLAAAFGAELAVKTGAVASLLSRLAANDAAPNTDRVFLPMAAAYGWIALVNADRQTEPAWVALFELAADERGPVRVATLDAFNLLTGRRGGADTLRARADGWLDADDRERRYGAVALACEALADRQALAQLRDHAGLLDFFSRVMDQIADAPRSADRSPALARLRKSVTRTLSRALAAENIRGLLSWFESICQTAEVPSLRAVLSETILDLRRRTDESSTVTDDLRRTLEGSAKPLRHAALIRPGTGRGKASRKIR